MFLGFADISIASIYIACIADALLCMVYGIINWNNDGDKKDKKGDNK